MIQSRRENEAAAAPSPRSLLLLSEVFPPTKGGSGRWFHELYPRLRRHTPHFLVGQHDDQHSVDDRLGFAVERIAWRTRTRTLRDGLRFLSLSKHVAKRCKAWSIDEVHAGRPLSEGVVARLASIRCGVRYSCYVHGEDLNVARTSKELTLLTRWALAKAKRVIANSSFTEGLLLNDWGLPPEQVAKLNPGVDVDYFRPPEAGDAAPEIDGWSGKRVLLTVGRLQERKGQDMAIRAVGMIQEKHPDLLYAIVGGGADEPRLRRLAAECGVDSRVQFLGEVGDERLLGCYQQCDFFALPNRTAGADVEGFGMVLLEAQSCGKPVIAGRSGGTVDTLLPNETGELINCDNPTRLAETLDSWLSDPEIPRRLAGAARRHVVSRYSWASLADEADRVFSE